MKIEKTGLIVIASLFISGVSAWILRGEFDKHFMMEGYFHIVSNAQQDYEVGLKFPSGEQIQFDLKAGSSFGFRQLDTGEGDVTVFIDGEIRDQVGYVTSMNNIVVLVIGEQRTEFSQIFPALITE